MSQLVALSLSIGLLGGVFTWLALGTLSVWAGFIAWACFFHCGGDTNALKQTIVGNVFGAVMAWVAAFLVLQVGLPAGVAVGVTVFILCMAAHVKLLSSIPASVYGYASTFAILLIDAQRFAIAALVEVDYKGNPVLQVAASMIVGALFGFASSKLAGVLTKKA
ncbi:MAG: DUF1097 domain-containing protein [Gemmatimonadales bacterium]